MITSLPMTEADILNEIVEPGRSRFSRQVAEEFLSLCFNEAAREREFESCCKRTMLV